MNSQLVPFVPAGQFKNDGKTSGIREMIMKYLYHWPLFILSITICVAIAFAYLRYVKPVYNVQARLLFNDPERRESRESGLQELNFVPTIKRVENEMEVLKSRTLMRKVVNDLQLWASYEQISRFPSRDLYKEAPLNIILEKSSGAMKKGEFIITIKDQNRFLLKQGDKETEVSFSSRLKNKSGVWKLAVTGNLDKFIGETIRVRVNNPTLVVEGLLAKLNTTVVNKQATVVEMSIKETLPDRGKDILNQLIQVYDSASVQDKNKVTESTLAFIDQRLSSVKAELSSIEKDVEGFKSSKGLTDIASQTNFYLDNFKTNDTRLNEINVQIQVIEDIEAYVNEGSGKVPSTAGISDAGLARLTEQLISLELQRDRLLATTPEGHPVFAPINRQIGTARESIRETIRGIKSSLLVTRRKLQAYNARFESSIKDLPSQERQYINIKRQQSTKEELYVYLLKKREEAALSYASTLSDSRTVDNAYYGYPISPKVPLIYTLAFLMGLIFPIGVITGRDVMNNRLISSSEIEENTSVPVMGELVYQEGSHPLVAFNKDSRIIAEQFRILRTNLLHQQNKGKNSKVTMLTSGASGEGKSFVTCNLGAALAASGKKTIILELDMRKPAVFKYFNLKEKPGLSDYLKGQASPEEIIQEVGGHANLFAIRSGVPPANPSELLEEPKLGLLIEWLKESFDEILIDTPPVQLVTDGMVISRYSDLNLYVLRQSFTHKSQLKFIRQLNKTNKLKNLHIIFNGVAIRGKYGYMQNVDYRYYTAQAEPKRLAITSTFKDVVKRF